MDSRDRIRSVNDLVSELFENVPEPSPHVKGATQTIPVVKPQQNPPQDEYYGGEPYPEQYVKKKSNTVLTVMGFILLALLLIVGIFMLYEVFQPPEADDGDSMIVTNDDNDDESEILIQNTNPVTLPPDESAEVSPYGTGAIMPNLVGQRLDTVERELGNSFTIRTKTYYSDTDEKGIISEQSIPAGVDYDPNAMNKLTLRVCLGPPNVQVPEFKGMTKKQYLDILSEMSIIYVTEDIESEEIPEGYVVGTGLEPGYYISIQNGDVLTVYISTGVPEDSSVPDESLPDDQGWSDDSAYTDYQYTDTEAATY